MPREPGSDAEGVADPEGVENCEPVELAYPPAPLLEAMVVHVARAVRHPEPFEGSMTRGVLHGRGTVAYHSSSPACCGA